MATRLTYCNPLPLPNYQKGHALQCGHKGPSYREMADPTVIRFEGRWYLFPSAGMLWHSDDMVNWTYHPIEPFNIGFAPTVAQRGEWLYLCACGGQMWRARHPFGPWEQLGTLGHDEDGNQTYLKDMRGKPVKWGDPCLFVDNDGSMYCYFNWAYVTDDPTAEWKLMGYHGQLFGVRLDAENPTRFPMEPVPVIKGLEQRWERGGEYNQLPLPVCREGSWMTKHRGRYYFQYSGVGTSWKNYAIGCWVSDHPLGPFTPQKRNPVLVHRGGLVNGCAHHSIVEGPDVNLWCFYTTLVRICHPCERRIGMDPVGFTDDGEMFIAGPTETPQWAPGVVPDPARGNDAGFLPLSVNENVTASSFREGHEPDYAVDNIIRTWWEAASEVGPQWLRVDLAMAACVHGARTMFGDRGLDFDAGVLPGPYAYRIEASLDDKHWTVVCDRSNNKVDRHIAYDTSSVKARYVRLVVLSAPPGLRISVWEFTVFGHAACDAAVGCGAEG